MFYSKLFGRTQKDISKQYEAINQLLLTQAGFIDQVASGIYTLLPLGTKVLTKIESIIREELNSIGAQEVMMPSLHPKTLWEQTGRWESVDVLFKTRSRYGDDFAIAPTHEETVTPLVKKFIKSYRDLPLALYHITPKFRDEPRPKSGILRGREFGMKDLYSFHTSKEDLSKFYKKVIDAYLAIFKRVGFNDVKITEASGGSFTKKFSHEFNVITPAGEVDLLYCNKCNFAQNEEVAQVKIGDQCHQCKKGIINKDRAIEIGNIFDLGTRFSESFHLVYKNHEGNDQPVYMGCYGIGTSRIIGAVVEVHHDDKGIIWPETVAPFQIHLVGLDLKNEDIKKHAYDIYEQLTKNHKLEVLFDDRVEASAGEKFSDADLIGIPHRLVVSKRTGDKVEYKRRNEAETKLVSLSDIVSILNPKS